MTKLYHLYIHRYLKLVLYRFQTTRLKYWYQASTFRRKIYCLPNANRTYNKTATFARIPYNHY